MPRRKRWGSILLKRFSPVAFRENVRHRFSPPQALLQQAVQQALAASANGHSSPSAAAPDDQQTGFCSIHQVAMEQQHNDRGTIYGHWLAAEQRHCNGRR
jgi:hypothetical protein